MKSKIDDAGEGNALAQEQLQELEMIVEALLLRQRLLVRMLAAVPAATPLPAEELLAWLAPQLDGLEQAAHIAALASGGRDDGES